MEDIILEEFENIPAPIGPFFKFPDEETFLKEARIAGFVRNEPVYDNEGNETEKTKEMIINASLHHAIDVIGIIQRGGEWDDEGNVITPPEVLEGWHVNYQGVLPEGWENYAVYPQKPVRVWA